MSPHIRPYARAFLSQFSRGMWALTLLGLPCAAQATHHTTYIPFIGEEYNPTPGTPEDHRYLTEIERLREALTNTLPVPDEGGAAGGMPLHITRNDEEISRVTLSSLRQNNADTLQSVTLLVRNHDLRVIGFINQATGRDTFFRLAEATIRSSVREPDSPPSAGYIRSSVTWPGTRTADLDLSSDYPEIERRARIGRYTSDLRVSTGLLRRDVATLSEFSHTNMNREGMRDMAASLLRILMAYFEGMRFHDIAQSIHGAGIDSGGTWTMGRDDAVLSENWSSISEFGSLSSFGDTDAGDLFFQPVALNTVSAPHATSYLLSSHNAGRILSRSTSWDSVMAVVDGARYWMAHQGLQALAPMQYDYDYSYDHDGRNTGSVHFVRSYSCPEYLTEGGFGGASRAKRDITVVPYDKSAGSCSNLAPLLSRLGSTYFMRHTATGILTTSLYA